MTNVMQEAHSLANQRIHVEVKRRD